MMASFFRFTSPEKGGQILINVEQIVRILIAKDASGANVYFVDGSHQDLPEDAWQKFKRSSEVTKLFYSQPPRPAQ